MQCSPYCEAKANQDTSACHNPNSFFLTAAKTLTTDPMVVHLFNKLVSKEWSGPIAKLRRAELEKIFGILFP